MADRKIAVITGASAGIGKETAIELARRGFLVVILVRNSEKSRAAFEEIKSRSGTDKVDMHFADLADLKSIVTACDGIRQKYPRVDVLINNAGVFKRKQERSVDGFEMSIAVNYIATFAVTMLLLPVLEKGSRVINLSSEIYKRGEVILENRLSPPKFNGDKAYANSKLLVVLFTVELSRRLAGKGITVNAVHPGVVGTDVFREYPRWFAKMLNLFITKPEKGAIPSIYLATREEVSSITGEYFSKTEREPIAPDFLSKANGLWDRTVELLGDVIPSSI